MFFFLNSNLMIFIQKLVSTVPFSVLKTLLTHKNKENCLFLLCRFFLTFRGATVRTIFNILSKAKKKFVVEEEREKKFSIKTEIGPEKSVFFPKKNKC